MMPEATLLGVQPVWQCYEFEGYRASVPLFQPPYAMIEDCQECGNPVVYKIVDYDTAQVEVIEAEVLCPVQQAVNVNALRFITKSVLAMDTSTGHTIDWHSQQLVLPLHQLLQLQAGQTMRLLFRYRPGDPIETLASAINVVIV
jgi:type I protein arginine methyltransferase